MKLLRNPVRTQMKNVCETINVVSFRSIWSKKNGTEFRSDSIESTADLFWTFDFESSNAGLVNLGFGSDKKRDESVEIISSVSKNEKKKTFDNDEEKMFIFRFRTMRLILWTSIRWI